VPPFLLPGREGTGGSAGQAQPVTEPVARQHPVTDGADERFPLSAGAGLTIELATECSSARARAGRLPYPKRIDLAPESPRRWYRVYRRCWARPATYALSRRI